LVIAELLIKMMQGQMISSMSVQSSNIVILYSCDIMSFSSFYQRYQ